MKLDYLEEAIKADFTEISRYYERIPSLYDVLIGKPPTEVREKESRQIRPDQRIDILRRQFRRIPASPRNGGLYRIAYTYPETVRESLSLDPNPFPSPHCRAATLQIINDPKVDPKSVARLFACCASSLRSDMRKRECYLISGERGVGKTAFLNYIFSTQHATFDEEHVIWVRLDLTRAQILEMSIMELLDVHTYDILSEHYMGGGEFPYRNEFFDDVDYEHCFEEHKRRSQIFSMQQFRDFLDQVPFEDSTLRDMANQLLLLEDGAIRDLRIPYAEKKRRSELLRLFMRKQGYTFIYILDGLDEATIPMQELDILQLWKGDIVDIIEGKNVPEGLYVICARHESFRVLSKHLQNLNIGRNLRQFVVYPISVSQVIEKRLELFRERRERPDKDLSVEHWSYESAKLLVDLTFYAIRCALDEVGIEPNILEEFSRSGHMRSILKFFRDALWETVAILDENYTTLKVDKWLPVVASLTEERGDLDRQFKNILKQKSYRIWSLASLNYENHYEKSVSILSNKRKLSSPDESGEFPLIPIMWGDLELGKREGYFNNHLMGKVRVLQLLYSAQEKRVTFSQVKRTISAMFQYDPDNIDLLLRAMMLERLIDFEPHQDIFLGLEESVIRLTDIGKRLIKEWIYIPAYVEYTMQLAAVPSAVERDFYRFSIRRISGPLANTSSYRAGDYLARLFPALAKFVAVISAVEQWEVTRLRVWPYYSQVIGPAEDLIYFEPEWITQKLRKSLEDQAIGIVRGANRAGYSKVLSDISKAYNDQVKVRDAD